MLEEVTEFQLNHITVFSQYEREMVLWMIVSEIVLFLRRGLDYNLILPLKLDYSIFFIA
jgi:hypothetical protein